MALLGLWCSPQHSDIECLRLVLLVRMTPSMTKIISLEIRDVRFPTSTNRDGSDAMNPDPDYSAAYVVLHTDTQGLAGHGLTFTIGRGNEICCAAIRAMEHLLVGLDLAWVTEDMGRFWRHMTSDS